MMQYAPKKMISQMWKEVLQVGYKNEMSRVRGGALVVSIPLQQGLDDFYARKHQTSIHCANVQATDSVGEEIPEALFHLQCLVA